MSPSFCQAFKARLPALSRAEIVAVLLAKFCPPYPGEFGEQFDHVSWFVGGIGEKIGWYPNRLAELSNELLVELAGKLCDRWDGIMGGAAEELAPLLGDAQRPGCSFDGPPTTKQIEDLQDEIGDLKRRLAAQKAVLESHDEIAHRITNIKFKTHAAMSVLHELADKLRSRKPEAP